MKEIKGQRILTITAEADEIYKICYENGFYKADIKNGTDGNIYISDEDEFAANDGVGKYILVEPCGFYNGLSMTINPLYIKSDGGGSITIVRY